MVRLKYQWEILVDYLRANGGRATIRQIHMDCYLQNVPDACMRARKHGIKIETVTDPDNPKIASYVLHEDRPHKYGACGGVCKDCAPKGMEKTYVPKARSLFPDPPTNQRHYE